MECVKVLQDSSDSSIVRFRIIGGGRTLRTEELSRDVESLAAHDNNLLAVEELLSDRAGQTAEQMALAVDAVRC